MAKRSANPTRLFLVERIPWATDSGEMVAEVPPDLANVARRNPFRPEMYWMPTSWRRSGKGGVPCKAFLTLEAADSFCKEQERLAWQTRNPFRHGEKPSDWTSLDAGRLRDWMLDIGLEPPAARAKLAVWRAWYDRIRPTLPDGQFLKVWEALDKVRFYLVVELTE